jgi:zinc/manganese transport system ATP-binding protein
MTLPNLQSSTDALNVSHVWFQYDSSHCVLNDISFTIPMGTLTAIAGPNGGGKSTLLKLIANAIPLQHGSIIARDECAYLPQSSTLDRSFPLLAEDVIHMGLWKPKNLFIDKKNVLAYLDHVGLSGLEKKSIHQLSGGQFQRLLFARLMAQNRSIILLDEPFTGVDYKTIIDMTNLIQTWVQLGKTVVIVLHDLEWIKLNAPHLLLLSHEVIAHGDTKSILTSANLERTFFPSPQNISPQS